MSRSAPLTRAVAAQAAMELRLTARRGENVLAMIVVPAAALVFFGLVGPGGARDVASLLPAALALAIVASGLVNLGIATAYERGYGVLKRLGGAPLRRDGLMIAKILVVALIAAGQVVVLLGVAALLLGWRPGPEASIAALAVTTIVGMATFSAIGLFLAGAVRPEAALVIANAAFLVALLLGGLLVPLDALPAPWTTIAALLPFGALANAFESALGGGGDLVSALAIVAAWGIAAAAATVRTFGWD